MFLPEEIKELNDLELLIYRYIMKNKKQTTYMTVRALAEAVHVSTATVIRFCKKMGCEGYSEFRVKFKMYLKEENEQHIENRTDIEELLHFFQGIDNIQFEEQMRAVVSMVKMASNVFFIGIGTSGILGKYGARYFSNLGRFSQHIDDPYYPILEDMYENTVIIVLSVSGETRETIEMVRRFQEHNCMIIAITNTGASTIAKMADYCLSYYVTPRIANEEYNVTTQVPVLYLMEAIGNRL